MLQGVRKLPQGHAATYELEGDQLRIWRYWQLPEPTRQTHVSRQELAEELEALLLNAVRRQLTADVPVALM